MSKENLDQFIQQISDSEELQARIGDEIDADSLIALGAECGCEFTAEELQESAELSDEELDTVAGGVSSTTTSCNLRLGRKDRVQALGTKWKGNEKITVWFAAEYG